jgi:hypothetical protein
MGKTTTLIAMLLGPYKGIFDQVHVFSPSVDIDSAWLPVKEMAGNLMEGSTFKLPKAHGHLHGGPCEFPFRALVVPAQCQGDSSPYGRALSHLPREDPPPDVRGRNRRAALFLVRQLGGGKKHDMFFVRFEHKLLVE